MTKDRSETRLDKKLLVNVGIKGFESMGLISNISQNGMFITTTEALPVHTEVSLLVGIADETFPLKGEVMWSHKAPETRPADIPGETGIKITDAPAQYLEYVEKMLSANH